ncbi:MAG: hypothetical protein CIT03_01965 [Methanobacterium sp.]|nr:MAG: hypothetical protein CIT03_01965 [Methanobacterium sp.]
MNKIKVIMLSCLSLKGLDDGTIIRGVDNYEEKLKFYLSKNEGIEIHMIKIGRKNKTIRKDNLIVHSLKKEPKLPIFSFILILLKMKRKIIEINPDILHIFSTGCIYGALALLFQKKYASMITAYGIIEKESKYYRADYTKDFLRYMTHLALTIPRKIYERLLLARIENIIVDSKSIKELVSSWTNSKIYVIAAGVEYDKVKKSNNNNSNTNMSNEKVDIFFVNNLQEIKGADVLIKSVLLVKDSFTDINVYIAGIGPQKKKLKKLVKELNLEKNVKFLGFVSNKEKYYYYSVCKIVVIPSRWDCQPAAFFDAAALAKPVIASDMSNPDVLINKKTGLIFKSEDFEDLAKKIKILLKNKYKREEMGINAQKNIVQYDWNEVANCYFNTYKKIIKNFYK